MSLSMFATLTPSPSPAGPSRSPSSSSITSPPPPAIGKKTSLFFSSPFAVSPPPPPPAPASVSSPHSRAASETYTYQPMTAHPTPPPSVHPDDSSDWGSPASSPGIQLARLRSLRAAGKARRDDDANELRRAASLRTRAFVDLHAVAQDDQVQLMESPTSAEGPGIGLGLSALGFMVPPSPTQQTPMTHPHTASSLVQHPTLPTATTTAAQDSKPPPSPTSPTRPTTAHRLKAGDVLAPSSSSRFVLVRTLGRGAFSAVWLAKDESERVEGRRKSECTAPRRGERVQGLRPKELREGSVFLTAAAEREDDHDELVAVKVMDRALCDSNDRTRVAFVREVEVLRHISHPSIIAYKHAFSTPSAHCLVLSYAAGGELFDIVADDAKWEQFRAYRDDSNEEAKGDGALLKRIFGELASAVAWMHSVNVVHRDIKLENVLLTRSLPARGEQLPDASTALVKLADFGLARFVDPAHPRLTTRCGSEAYAAPELLLSGGSRYRGQVDDFDVPPSEVPSYARTIDSGSGSSDESSTGPGTPPALWGLSEERTHERVYTSSSSMAAAAAGAQTPPKVLLEPATPNLGASPARSRGSATSDFLSPPALSSSSIHSSPSYASTATTHDSPNARPSRLPRTSSRREDADGASDREGYDPRLTDAWALGVVLYALTTRALPFGAAESSRDRRRAASAQYGWSDGELEAWWDDAALHGAKSIVGRLLVRDATERARVEDVCASEWLR